MNREERCKRTKEQNEKDWEEIEPLISKAVDLVWQNMNEILQSRFPKEELINHLWLRDDWTTLLVSRSDDSLLRRAKYYIWQLIGGTSGCSESRKSKACSLVQNRELFDGNEDVAEEIYHNSYRAQPADPSDMTADEELLSYLIDKLTKEEHDIFKEYFEKHKTLAAISKRRGYSINTIWRRIQSIKHKMRSLADEQGW